MYLGFTNETEMLAFSIFLNWT